MGDQHIGIGGVGSQGPVQLLLLFRRFALSSVMVGEEKMHPRTNAAHIPFEMLDQPPHLLVPIRLFHQRLQDLPRFFVLLLVVQHFGEQKSCADGELMPHSRDLDHSPIFLLGPLKPAASLQLKSDHQVILGAAGVELLSTFHGFLDGLPLTQLLLSVSQAIEQEGIALKDLRVFFGDENDQAKGLSIFQPADQLLDTLLVLRLQFDDLPHVLFGIGFPTQLLQLIDQSQ